MPRSCELNMYIAPKQKQTETLKQVYVLIDMIYL